MFEPNRKLSRIIVTGSFVAKEGQLNEALRLSLEHVRCARSETGCISHALSFYKAAENASRLEFLEEWSDTATIAAQFAAPASRAFAKAIKDRKSVV